MVSAKNAPNFSAFRWSPHGSLVSVGQNFVTTRVVHLPKRTETSLITESDQSGPNHQLMQLCTARTAGPIRTRLCGPCIAALAGLEYQSIRCCIRNHKNCVPYDFSVKHFLSIAKALHAQDREAMGNSRFIILSVKHFSAEKVFYTNTVMCFSIKKPKINKFSIVSN